MYGGSRHQRFGACSAGRDGAQAELGFSVGEWANLVMKSAWSQGLGYVGL
jgi:hypothetical protein